MEQGSWRVGMPSTDSRERRVGGGGYLEKMSSVESKGKFCPRSPSVKGYFTEGFPHGSWQIQTERRRK